MTELTLVHLESQKEAVLRYVAGWTKEDVLAWFREWGAVKKVANKYDSDLYIFVSKTNLQSAFRFDEEDNLIILNWRG